MAATRNRTFLLNLLIAAVVVSACGSALPSSEPTRPSTPTTTASAAPPRASSTEVPESASPTSSCAERTFVALTPEQRIGQLFVIGLAKDRLDTSERAAIRGLHFGSMALTTQTSIGADRVRQVTDAVQSLATPANTGSVRFFIAANQEGGLIQGLSGSGFERIPSALEQGSLSVAQLRAKAGRWGRQLAAAGVNFNFAPVADVVPPGTDATNAPIGQLQREFGHDPQTVAGHVAAFIAGMRQARVATSAKHFPGLGRVEGNTDFTSGVVDSVTTRDDPFIEPFATAIDAHVPFVMVSLATYDRIDPDHLAAFSRTVISGMLRDELGFRGVVISDAIGGTVAVKDIPPADRAIDFLGAGGDMIISNQVEPASEMARAIAARASQDLAFQSQVDDAAQLVLQAKDHAGLLPCS